MSIKKFALDAGTAKMIKEVVTEGVNAYKSLKAKNLSTPSGSLSYLKEKVLPISLGLGGVGLITSQADQALDRLRGTVDDVKHKIGLKAKIERIISLQPSLAQFDTDKVILYYEQLRHFAPDVASNDLAAASYIKHALAMHDQGVPIATYDTLAKTQKNLTDSGDDKKKGLLGKSLLSGSSYKVVEGIPSYNFQPFFPEN